VCNHTICLKQRYPCCQQKFKILKVKKKRYLHTKCTETNTFAVLKTLCFPRVSKSKTKKLTCTKLGLLLSMFKRNNWNRCKPFFKPLNYCKMQKTPSSQKTIVLPDNIAGQPLDYRT
jgi:hypothetical protein